MSIISLVSVSEAFAGATGAEASALAAQGSSLVATYDWAFLFGPGLVVGLGNGLILGYLMYRSGLLPRRMAMVGVVGGPMLMLSFGLILFGVYENGSGPAFLLALPEIIWEGSIGVYAAWKGFRSSSRLRGRGRGDHSGGERTGFSCCTAMIPGVVSKLTAATSTRRRRRDQRRLLPDGRP